MPRHEIKVELKERSYPIMVEPGILSSRPPELEKLVSGRKCLVITDSNVEKIYSPLALDLLSKCGAAPSAFAFPAGEASKNIGTLEKVWREAVRRGLDRGSCMIALGGGVPGDIAGFAAATYMRGIPYAQIPTTLLAMVDSSVGGKTAIDLPEGKNLAGAFWQPKLVLIDPDTLKTLPDREIRCGMAEVVKYGVIMDRKFFSQLEADAEEISRRDIAALSKIAAHCCRLKARVVAGDEREEGGLRAILNFGHSFGHAVESCTGYGEYAHGEAVAIGMMMAAKFAEAELGFPHKDVERINWLLVKMGLSTKLTGYDPEVIYACMTRDKKASGGKVRIVAPDSSGIGAVRIVEAEREKILPAIRSRCD